MPEGLADTLTRQEFLDLCRFLSELGKPGTPYAPDTVQVVRRWRVLNARSAVRLVANPASLESPAALDRLNWQPAYSLVSGVLPFEDLLPGVNHKAANPAPAAFARFELEVTSAGPIGLRLNSPAGVRLWVGGKHAEVKGNDVELDLDRGRHTLTFHLDLAARKKGGLRVELRDMPGGGQAQPVGGR